MADDTQANTMHAHAAQGPGERDEGLHSVETYLHAASDAREEQTSYRDGHLRAHNPTERHGVHRPAPANVPTSGSLLAHRYRLGRILGTGAFGRVFYAWDHERSHAVAIKILKNTHPNALLHFKREFRSISELRHPNLVRVFQLVRDQDTWFIVMEMLEGVPFVPYRLVAHDRDAQEILAPHTETLVSEADTEAATHTQMLHRLRVQGNPKVLRHKAPLISRERLDDVFYQLARGVDALHRMRIVHCDLKPSNIIVTPQGRVVILDFGVVRHMLHLAAQNQDEGIFAGTRHYVAPEVTPTSVPATSFDWYAVGVILWQFLTGYHAEHLAGLTGEERASFLDHAAERFPEYQALYALCEKLLRVDPAQRATFEDVHAACGSPSDFQESLQTKDERTQMRDALHGRDDILVQLHHAWDSFNDGHPQAVLIEGHPGNGKTAVVETFLYQVQRTSASTRVLLAQCQSNESVGFRAFDEIVDGLTALIATMPKDEREEVLHLCTPALCQLFPVLRSLDPRLENISEAPDTGSDPRFALRELLCHVAGRYSIVIWIEDIECADEDSLQWIGQIFTPALRPNAFLLITKNIQGELRKDRFDINTLGYAIERIPLFPLDDEASRALVHMWLPANTRGDAELIDRIVAIGAGRPQMLHTLCFQGLDIDALQDHVTGTELLARRIAALPQSQRDILAVVAVCSRPVPIAVLAFITEQSIESIDVALDALLDAFLLRQAFVGETAGYEIVHDDVRQSTLKGLDPQTRRALHRALIYAADTLPNFTMRPLTLLSHLLHAGDVSRARRDGLRLASIAENNGAYAAAAQIYNRLIEMERARSVYVSTSLRERAVELNIQAGHLVYAADLLAELALEAPTPAAAHALHERAEETYILCGHIDTAQDQREQRKQTRSRTAALLPKPPRLVNIIWLKERLIRRVERLDMETLRYDEGLGDFESKMRVFRMAGLDMGLVDPVLGLEFSMRELHIALDSRSSIRIARALAGVSPIVASASRREQKIATQWTEVAMALGERAGDRASIEWARICQANIDYQMGDYDVAWEKLRAGTAWLQKHASSQSMMIAYANSHLIYCAWAMGKVEALRAAYYGQLGDVRAWRNQVLEAAITIGGFNTWLIDDVPSAAKLSLAQLHILDTGGPFRLLDFFIMYYSAEIALYERDVTRLEETIAALFRFETTLLARMIEQVRNASRFLLARLLIAQAMHQNRLQSPRLFIRLKLIGMQLRRSSEPLGIGWGHQVIGASYLLRGRPTQARPHYERAIAHFEDANIKIFAAPTRAAAIASGVLDASGDPFEELRQMGVVHPQKYTRVCHPYIG